MYKPTRKHLYIAGAVVLGALLVYFGFMRESPVTVEVIEASRGALLETVDAEGKTRYHDRYTVTAPVSGRMFRVAIHEGANVPKGFLITRIDPAPPRPTDPSSQPVPDMLPAAYPVYAPESGRVTRVFITSERIVEAGTPILEISKPSRLELVVDVLSADATHVRAGMTVLIENWGGDDVLRGRVTTVEPQAFTKVSALGVEEQRVDVVADFAKVPEGLGDNYRVDASIVLWEGKNVLQVPSNTLFRDGDRWAVYVADGSRARLREVEVGHRSPLAAEIVKGLSVGEAVVLHPPNTVSDGTKISY